MALKDVIPWVSIRPGSPIPTAPTTAPAHQPLVAEYALVLTGVSCVLSILGCLGIFTTFYRFPEYRTNSRKLLLYLTLSDIFTALGNLVGVVRYYVVFYRMKSNISDCSDPDIVCKAQSYVTTVSNLWSFFWMCVISFYFVIAIVNRDVSRAEKMMVPSHVISWGLPVFLVSMALGFDVLGEDLSYTSGGWCWITECQRLPRGTKLAWNLMTGKFWEFATYIILIINYALLKFFVWKRTRYDRSMINQHVDMPGGGTLAHNDQMFVFVPIILVVLRIWGTIKFILSTVYTDVNVVNDQVYKGQEVLTVLQGIGDSGQGFWNFILFCVLTKDIRKKLFSCTNLRPNYANVLDRHSVDSIGREESSSDEDDVGVQTPRSPLASMVSNSLGYNTIDHARNHVA